MQCMLQKKMVEYQTLGLGIYEGNRIVNHTNDKRKCHVQLPRSLSAFNITVHGFYCRILGGDESRNTMFELQAVMIIPNCNINQKVGIK